MNIFVLDLDPVAAAQYHLDVHVVKMILELGQMLSTAHRILDNIPPEQDILYKKTHFNHPCAKWVRENSANYFWAFDHFLALGEEYTFRYNKTHKSINDLRKRLAVLPKSISISSAKTKFALAMPEEYKSDNPVDSYRKYYQFKVNTLSRISWKNRSIPPFIQLENDRMPTYTFRCNECGNDFDVVAKMSESKGENLECPNCGSIGKSEQQIGASKIVSGYRTNHRVPDGFKDVLKTIKKNYPRNKIDVV
jgi:putative FmdB family regulatory protein